MLFRNGSITPWTYENLFTGSDHSKQDLLTHSLAGASFYVKVSPKKLQKAITSQLPTCTLLFYFFSDSLDISLISPELCTYTHTWTHTYVSTLADCLFLFKKKSFFDQCTHSLPMPNQLLHWATACWPQWLLPKLVACGYHCTSQTQVMLVSHK